MNLMRRLKNIERKVGPCTYEEFSEACERHMTRLRNLLYHSFFPAYLEANPDYKEEFQERIDNEMPELPEVDMSPAAFNRDQDLIEEFYGEPYRARLWACGRSEKEMLKHYFRLLKVTAKEKEARQSMLMR